MASPQSPVITYVRGRLMRDPHISDRKDGSGNKVVMGRLRCIEKYVDQAGDERQLEPQFDLRIFDPESANAIAAAGPKAGQLIEVWGRISYETDEYTDKTTGELKSSSSFRITVSGDNPEHKAALL